MAGLNGGDLRHRVSLQRKDETQDPVTGEMITSWVEVAPLWAKVRPRSAREQTADNAIHSIVTADITIRYRTDIDPSMRIVHRGKYYNIEGVVPDNESGLEWITLPCSEGANEG